MPDPKGDRLIVNLGAAQARRRLKGFGCGVKKVQTGGTKQAVIIHTARGRNLQALKKLFADVGCSSLGEEMDEAGSGKVGATLSVGDVVVDVDRPELGQGVVIQDNSPANSPATEQCLTIAFESLGKVIVFTAQRNIERV